MGHTCTLDQLYGMTGRLFSRRDAQRSASQVFAQLVEACGGIAVHARGKLTARYRLEEAIADALAAYFALMAKFRVTSIEALIYRKFPYACPYCGLTPHEDAACKSGGRRTLKLDDESLARLRADNAARRPAGLADWQRMFGEIYPPGPLAQGAVVLLEEIGELAEARRAFAASTESFAEEAADVFSRMMAIANARADVRLAEVFNARYPGRCIACRQEVCGCVPTLTATSTYHQASVTDSLFRRTPSES